MKTLEMTTHYELTSLILRCCFEVANELGSGFLESIYKNSLCVLLKQNFVTLSVEQSFEIYFRDQKVGTYRADLIVENSVIVELKCCKTLLPEHQWCQVKGFR
jgi:GxxExxY protein